MPQLVPLVGPAVAMPVVVNRSDLAECSGVLRPGDKRKHHPDRIVLHRNTASNDWFREHPEDVGKCSHVEALAKFHSAGKWAFRIFPYHYFVDRDGTIYQIHDEMTVSPHAQNVGNWRAIGVSMNIDGRVEAPPPAVLESVVWLCSDILGRWPGCSIVGHSASKRCPGPKVDVAWIDSKARHKEVE